MTKIIEAKAVISADDRTGPGLKSAMDKINAMTKAQNTFAKSGAKDIALFTGHVDQMNRRLGAVDGFRAQHEALKQTRQQFRAAQDEVVRLGRAMKEVEKPTRSMTLEYERSQRAVKQAAAAYQDKASAVKAAKAEMAAYGVTLRNIGVKQAEASRVVRSTGGATSPFPRPTPLPGTNGADTTLVPLTPRMIGPAAAAYGAVKLHGAVAETHHDFQRAYLHQRAVLGMEPRAQKPLLDQALKIGQDTQFTNADIVRAQTDIGSKLPKELQGPDTIKGITEHVKNYALFAQISMEEASKGVVSWMKTRGYDISTPAAAEKSARRAANQMVEVSTTTGAKAHDLVGDSKFGGAPGRVGGFSESFSNAISAQLLRQGYDGAMSGTFIRAAATKLSAPTSKARAAMAAMGINYDDYVKSGVGAGSDGLNKVLKQQYGKGLNKDQRAKVDEILGNPEIMGDAGAYGEALSEALSGTFARKGKDGKVRPQDAQRLAKTIEQYRTLTAGSVDTESLFKMLLSKGLTPAQAKAIMGQEHGGRALSINPDQLVKDQKTFQNVPDDRAEKGAAILQGGAQGQFNQMVGSIESFKVALGEATDGARSFAYQGIGALFDALTDKVKGNGPDTLKKVDNLKTLEAEMTSLSTRLADSGLTPSQRENIQKRFNVVQGKHMLQSDAVPAVDGSRVTAKVEQPIDVTGKVQAELQGKADVSVSIKVQGPAVVTGQGVTASGHIRGSVGTSTAGNYE